ncbi:hypothetical protein RDWZM_008488 [Blomia tropicalis]|uniref:Ras-GEF domain-containing protein n=1 Tax=Blomia tropicalis TaxID=40697 RepID=A0A9Q0RLG7_BLOTA|nr:hypothetical protein RDWZM_008488 [Blomia tropicalis]
MSIIETRFDSSNNHRSIQKQNGIIHHDENRITIEAEIHQYNQQLSVNDLNVVDEVELVELNPNVTLLPTDTIKRLPINVIKQKRLESQLSFNYNDCEQTYEESQVVDFNPVDMKPIHMYLLKEANNDVEDSRKYSETTSINIHEALDTLDNALLNVDNLSNYSGTWNSSMKSRSIISLSFSEVSESSLSSECSEKTLRMGNVNESIHSIENDSKSDSSNSTITNEHIEEPKSQKFIRRIERFGFDLKDTCLFPLALPMDGSDIYKGASTWESINLLAECVLSIWTNKTNLIAINDNAFILKNEPTHYRWYNPVLKNSTKYLCLQPELSDRFLIQPHVHLPFRRSISDTDLTQLNFSTPFTCNDVSVLTKSSKSNEIRNEMSIDTKESNDDIRNRTKSSLGKYVKNHINSFKDLKQRKCRFNLNLTKFMTTDAKQLAAKNELENPLKFARKITKFEKNYILAIPASEMISLVFKKELSQLERLKEMLEFGQELSQLCANLICSEFTVEDQSQLIVNAIETAFLLHQKNNFQSFKSVMRGLHLPEVFRLRNAWKVVQQKFPLHLR